MKGRFQEKRAVGAERPPKVRFTEGLRIVWQIRLLRLIVLAEVVAYSVVGWAMVADAPLAKLFDVGAIGFAALISCWGVGMLIGSWGIGRWLGERRIEAKILLIGMLIDGVMIAFMGLSPWFVPILIVSVIGGAASGCVNVSRQTLLQRSVPDHLRSRVFAVAEVTATVSFTLGLAIAGPAIVLIGVRPSYVLSGVVFALGALILIPVLRRPVIQSPSQSVQPPSP